MSDRDPKFFSELWTSIFDTVGSKFLFWTAYYLQTDSKSECTNQTTEIALQYLYTMEDPKSRPSILYPLQHNINNTKSETTGRSPNAVVYRFTTNDALQLLASPPKEPFNVPAARIEIADAVAMAAMNAKQYYDQQR
jgi:hypothetical protein